MLNDYGFMTSVTRQKLDRDVFKICHKLTWKLDDKVPDGKLFYGPRKKYTLMLALLAWMR